MWNQKPSFRFEIENFSDKEAGLSSKTFVSGGCEWYLNVYPKGACPVDDHLSLYLTVANRNSLGTGWKRSAAYYFLVLNQSDKELYRSSIGKANSFCAETPAWGFPKTLPLRKLQEKGFLEKDILIIEIYIKTLEAFDGEGGDVSEKKKKTVDINGFQVLASQVTSAKKIFAEHPDIAEDFKPKNQALKNAYMNVLLKLVKRLHKPPNSLSKTKLSKACSELCELLDVGFKLDWLNLKLEEVSLQKDKAEADVSRIQHLEERLKNLELMESGFKIDALKSKLEEVSLDRKKADADGSRIQQLEERIKNLELMELGFKLDSLKTNLDEVLLERKKSDDAQKAHPQQVAELVKDFELIELGFKLECLNTKLEDVVLERKKSDAVDVSRFQQVEKRVKDLELMELGFKLDCLNTKLEDVSFERKNSEAADGFRFEQLEESIKKIELMVSYLKVELDKKKDKSSADGFLLVEEID